MFDSLPSDSSSPETIVSISNETSPTSIIPSIEIIDEYHQPLLVKQKSIKETIMADVSRRLNTRKRLHNQL